MTMQACCTCDAQVFSNNMSVKGEPVIKACKATDNWTCVTFKPDLSKFGMTVLEEETASLMRKRVYDLAGVLGKTVKVCAQIWLFPQSLGYLDILIVLHTFRMTSQRACQPDKSCCVQPLLVV